MRRIRGVDERHHLTLMCRDLSEIAAYAMVDNAQYRLLKRATPGSYTFILRGDARGAAAPAAPARKTIGVRVPGHPVAQALLAELGEPMLSSTLHAARRRRAAERRAARSARALEHDVDLVIDAGPAASSRPRWSTSPATRRACVREGKGDRSRARSARRERRLIKSRCIDDGLQLTSSRRSPSMRSR